MFSYSQLSNSQYAFASQVDNVVLPNFYSEAMKNPCWREAFKGWHLYQMDATNAFLHGEFAEEIYMNPPEGYNIPKGKARCWTKSLHGLKQASKQWYTKLFEAFVQWGFKVSYLDHSLFVKKHGSDFLELLVYVDDIVIASTSVEKLCHKPFWAVTSI